MDTKQYKYRDGVIGNILSRLKFYIKRCYMSFIEIMSLVLTFIAGGGLVRFVTLKSDKRKGNAQADGEEINNLSKVTENWQNLTNELQEQLNAERQKNEALQSKLDERWADTLKMRDELQEKMLKITDLSVELAKQEPMICHVRGCEKREPQTGF